MSVNSASFGPTPPPLTAAELEVIRLDIERKQQLVTPQALKARRWRWRRWVVRQGGKGLRGLERERFLREDVCIHHFDHEERVHGYR